MAKHRQQVAGETRREWETLSGRETEALYGPDAEDARGWKAHDENLGFPGEFPFTRGPYASMYRGKFWTMRQFAGFGSASDTNRRYRFLLDHGQTGLSVAFDMPTLMGYDSDDPLALGEVGRCGVAVSSLEDMEILFDGIPMADVSTSMTINGPAAIIWAMYIVAAKKQGADPARLRGTLQNDILKEYIAQKEYLFPPEPSISLVVDTIEYAAKTLPLWHAVSVSGYHIREAGSTSVQELAFTLADGFAYVEASIERGLDVDAFAPRLSFFFNAHADFFEEICKFRAARRIYARRMRDRYGAKNPASWRLRTHAQTAGCSLTAQQPENNIVRTAYQAMAAVLGGTQSLHTNSMDETLALPTEKAVKIALRTQQVLANETGVADVADPLGGSWFVEELTDQMEAEAEEYFRRIDELGGVVESIRRGFFQQEIGTAAYRFQRALDAKRYVQVGVNAHLEAEEAPIETLRIPDRMEEEQAGRVKALRERRDPEAVGRALARVEEAARAGENMMPAFLGAVEVYATLGEIVGVCRGVYGEYLEPAVV
ncbi:MAG: methylmalonyl-CoA mutase family protein [Gemmatimonadota bacterium]|jgi:methylmalonyl-CoA mutase N-terminal domain/subunit|nr:methylmalonyl-CoA mutase [Gemmatimonadota bacterium]MDP6460331.1 methylmalonyl-CoA mutase family protein [Gemmatimonadota bacterium]MDP6803367.1 methylmalonyl-CoA mutase family protein [Gemmatimonadota bacterium]MDP7032775.1 methylmalonyl-CoA mutase family protein [Gemmatimonadota bacterium]